MYVSISWIQRTSLSLFREIEIDFTFARYISQLLDTAVAGFFFFFLLFSPARTYGGRWQRKRIMRGGKGENEESKVLQWARSCRRFMDSARSHLKDYIEQTITNRLFFSRRDRFNSLPYPLWYRFSYHPFSPTPPPRSIPFACKRSKGESSNCSLMTMRRRVVVLQLCFMGIPWCRYWLRFLSHPQMPMEEKGEERQGTVTAVSCFERYK